MTETTFTNKGPRGHVTPVSQRVASWEAQDKSSAGTGKPRSVETYERAPARNRRAELLRKRGPKPSEDTDVVEETPEAPAARETAEVGPAETQAVTMKPATRKAASKKKSAS